MPVKEYLCEADTFTWRGWWLQVTLAVLAGGREKISRRDAAGFVVVPHISSVSTVRLCSSLSNAHSAGWFNHRFCCRSCRDFLKPETANPTSKPVRLDLAGYIMAQIVGGLLAGCVLRTARRHKPSSAQFFNDAFSARIREQFSRGLRCLPHGLGSCGQVDQATG